MKNLPKLKIATLTILTLAHNVLFWQNPFGLNTVLFSILIATVLFSVKSESFKEKNVLISLTGVFISVCMTILHGSDIAKFSYTVSTIIFIGFTNAHTLRNIFYPFISVLETAWLIPSFLESKVGDVENEKNTENKLRRIVKLSLFPVLFLVIFYWIYKWANPVFDNLTSHFWKLIGDGFLSIFEHISIGRLFFALFGFVISTVVLLKSSKDFFITKLEALQNDNLLRVKIQRQKTTSKTHVFSFLALKNEYQSGLLMFGLINLLLLIVNVIDINWIWLNFDVNNVVSLSQFVHEGTYLLIASILLSMVIMEYFFRRNLNFYAKNKLLRVLSYVWIVQNVIMAISVGLRNYHYINEHGLAYKRIGVIFFLVLTLVGLVTQFLKIKNVKSPYFILRINSWAFYAVMLVLASINWDLLIVNHNLNHSKIENIDYTFLTELSPKTLPSLVKHVQNNSLNLVDQELLKSRILVFQKKQESQSWLSWNYADSKAYHSLKSQK